jgi:hypothetical protein
MQKRSARRSLNYGRQDGESERAERDDQEQIDSSDSKKNNSTTDSLIADMAQGFIQAQAKATNNEMGPNNKEVMSLLEKVNSQLEEIKRANIDKNNSMPSRQTVGNQGNSGQSVQGNSTQQGNSGQSVQGNSTQQGNSGQSAQGNSTQQGNSGQSAQGNSMQQGNNGQSAQDNSTQQVDQKMLKDLKSLVSSMLQGKENSKDGGSGSSTSENSNQSSTNKPQQDTIDIQTVSQLLAQSQYELATELENSLQKLKQVISESEKVATKISNLLSEETKKKS